MKIILRSALFFFILFVFPNAYAYAQSEIDGAPVPGVSQMTQTLLRNDTMSADAYIVAESASECDGYDNRIYSRGKVLEVQRISPVQEVPVVMKSRKYRMKGSFVAGM